MVVDIGAVGQSSGRLVEGSQQRISIRVNGFQEVDVSLERIEEGRPPSVEQSLSVCPTVGRSPERQTEVTATQSVFTRSQALNRFFDALLWRHLRGYLRENWFVVTTGRRSTDHQLIGHSKDRLVASSRQSMALSVMKFNL